MSNVGALPNSIRNDCAGNILTFVVPAPRGCNLRCPFCMVSQRHETKERSALSPEDYARFVRETGELGNTLAICIQGYEPLLPQALPYTQAILASGRLLGLKTSLVTNGTYLKDAIDILNILEPSKIAVSLDAASSVAHDRLRGKKGAWAAAVRGVRNAVEMCWPNTELKVTSVLLPKRRAQLEGMPTLLKEIGIQHWIVNVLDKIGRDEIGGPVGDRRQFFQDLLILKREADRCGIDFVVDDEFGNLDHEGRTQRIVDINALRVRTLPQSSDIFRLVPSGQCSMGTEILKQITPDTPCWRPGEVHAGEFVQQLQAAHRKPTYQD